MPSVLPAGEPAPDDSALPLDVLNRAGDGEFGVYVHVPFCGTRCGYCDFNTYTAAELGGGVSRETYTTVLRKEFELAARTLQGRTPKVSTVFIGGGTPTLLPATDLAEIVTMVADTFGLQPDAEITTEANPETVDDAYFRALRQAGFTRISLGMQSTASRVLAVLERNHTPGRAITAAQQARNAGFDHVNLDLIYGTPGEDPEDFAASLRAAIGAGADHVSAYALIVEDGTRLAGQVRRGVIPQPSDDVAADRYLMAEEILSAAGFGWYEVSNWARNPAARCRHNMMYWRGANWWGFGPGAHSHVGGVRWWNVKHPGTYGTRLDQALSPAAGREILTARQQYVEDVMLRVRLAEGMGVASLEPAGVKIAEGLLTEGLLADQPWREGIIQLTLRGRLLADAVIRDIVD